MVYLFISFNNGFSLGRGGGGGGEVSLFST